MAISDLFTQTMDGGDPVVATVSTNRSSGGTSLACDDLDNWPNDTVHYITYKKKASGAIDYDTLQTFKGIVSGNTIGTVTFKSSPTGSDLGNDIGDYVRLAPTASWSQDLFDGLTAQHNVDGTHKDITTDNLTVSSNVTLPTGSIGTPAIAQGAVESDKNKVTVGFRAEKTTPQSIPTSTSTLVTWPQVVYDFGGNFSNNGFTAPFDGLYRFSTRLGDFTTSSRTYGSILVNGNEAARSDDVNGRAISLSVALPLKEGDTVTVQIRHQASGSSDTSSAPYTIWFEGYLVGLVDESIFS